MKLQIREATAADEPECGRICYEAFAAIADAHNFPHDFPSVDVAAGALSGMIAHPGFFGVVAEGEGRISGAIFSTNGQSFPVSAPSPSIPTYRTVGSAWR